jgi:2-polyprenyl-3-methyl-5-hydroxy-6-metoxy-1,4-benzoquinol methylase
VPLIDFGLMPLVNTYDVTDKFPLSVNRCVSCCHLQLSEFVDPYVLYSHYTYCSGTGKTAANYFASFAREAVSYVPNAYTVMDLASNDGSQLDAFKALGLATYGIDPAKNLNKVARAKGHNITDALFENVGRIAKVDIITAQNVFGHTPRPLEFLIACKDAMHEESRLFIATSQANMIVNGECNTIYHEHISYFNAHSMCKLSERAGLIVLDILMHDIHGTSFVFVLGKTGEPNERVADRLEWEFLVGMMAPPIYGWWKAHVMAKVEALKKTISDYSERGFLTVGCGAAAKGISMLNMAGVKLDVLVDTTPTKWNRVTNGMPIAPFTEIANITAQRVLFVILAHNLSAEIRKNTLALRNDPFDVFIETR